MVASGVDRISWASSPNGEFDLKEAYKLVCETTVPKIKCFLWQCLHKSIPSRDVLIARGLNIPHSCPLGCNEVESIIHILRDCPQARAFWDSFSPPLPPNIFYGTNLLDWLRINCTSHQRSSSNIPWSYLFPFSVWCLWLRRNKVIFRESSTCKSLMEETISKATEFTFLGVNERARRPQTIIQVQWFSPLERWFKLNTDRSSSGNLGRVGGGGIIRNSHGEWVSGFARAIGYTTSVAAELWALWDESIYVLI
ncbi:putative ribonuclease h protein [Quercus suber]|uniref:Ribonuclease h protein n=1 Tax=Quercus suber TaxID=58331 RepID=A0AAW0L3T0_QUESU|nr:putative ribonuclease h protein [Quercus suber]